MDQNGESKKHQQMDGQQICDNGHSAKSWGKNDFVP